jgi:hypothetical protein
VVVGVVGGVGFTTWQLAPQDTGRFAWLVDAATDLSELEKNLNHLSEKGFGVHRILSAPIGTEQSTFVIVWAVDRYNTGAEPAPDRNRIVTR